MVIGGFDGYSAHISMRLGSALIVFALLLQQKPFTPSEYQPGKDVVWVPSSPAMVAKMLDLAKVTPQDYVIDLGSGDGRNVIAAAKRGARGLGVEFNPDMVALSRKLATEAGVADKARFVEGDMYEADISQATVMALFLLPTNLDKLKDKFLALKPGTRIVVNTFGVTGWTPDASDRLDNCTEWCQLMLYIVPARVAGRWLLGEGTLTLTQDFQAVGGTLADGAPAVPISNGTLTGDRLTFDVNGTKYAATVSGDAMSGEFVAAGSTTPFVARRVK